jgi:hypothetical protein
MLTAIAAPERTQAARLDRGPDIGYRRARAERLAQQLDGVLDDAESALDEAVAARHSLQLAWLSLCDRGWPSDRLAAPVDCSHVWQWLASWSELVALPVRVVLPRDLVRQRLIRRRLDRCETSLRGALPSAVWRLADPLDETGRSTLAFILLGLQAWLDSKSRCAAALAQRERMTAFLTRLSQQARALDLAVPVAPLDLAAWREVAAAARLLVVQTRHGSAA